MLAELTKYLFKYRRLYIPSVGVFELVAAAPEYKVTDKSMMPPVFHVNHNAAGTGWEHQLDFLSGFSADRRPGTRNELESVGKRIIRAAKDGPFTWNGVGTFQFSNGQLVWQSQVKTPEALNIVVAEKVMRGHRDHARLVGDRQLDQGQQMEKAKSRRSFAVIAGWILLALAIAAVLFLLFRENFSPLATGLRQRVL